jgi:hypothetical protein
MLDPTAQARRRFRPCRPQGPQDREDLVGQADGFDLRQGGNDTVRGGLGNDDFDLGAKLNAGDAIDGGAGTDIV